MERYRGSDGLSAVDCGYINVHNIEDEDIEEADVLALCTVWVLQNPEQKGMLVDRLAGSPLINTVAMICLSLERPWTLLQELRSWLMCVTEVMEELLTTRPQQEQRLLRDEHLRYIRSYRNWCIRELNNEKLVSLGTSSSPVAAAAATPTDVTVSSSGMLGLPSEAVLDCNVGIPIIVVCCKSDACSALDTRDEQGKLECIQAYLRKSCLAYGAGLVYTSMKDGRNGTNVALLYRYLMHRLYQFPLREPANTSTKDALFLPSGWDTPQELAEYASKTAAAGLQVAAT
eukprot:GHVS01077034.1.p1 GENE.GHVS01077034.1~~GHVS01077034.1.p1  ORF type:complete len:287 (+),score=31.82 GHVS01077034.1:148-1008(+)